MSIADNLTDAARSVQKIEDEFTAYRTAINAIDDYFEYMNESKADRKVVHQILKKLTTELHKLQ